MPVTITNNPSNQNTGASGTVLQGQGIGTADAHSTATYPSTATGTGTILRADGTIGQLRQIPIPTLPRQVIYFMQALQT